MLPLCNYEDIKILKLDYKEDILDNAKNDIICVDTVAIVSNRYFVEYIIYELLNENESSVYGMNYIEDTTYCSPCVIYINRNGYIEVNSIPNYTIKNADIIYLDMDGVLPDFIVNDYICSCEKIILFGINDIPITNDDIIL